MLQGEITTGNGDGEADNEIWGILGEGDVLTICEAGISSNSKNAIDKSKHELGI